MKTPGGRAARDIDDAHAERHHGRKLAEALGEVEKSPPRKPVPRRAGVVLDSPGEHQEENVADPPPLDPSPPPEVPEEPPAKVDDRTERRKRDEHRRRQKLEAESEEEPSGTTAGHLAFADAHKRALHARKMGFDQTPGLDEAVEALLADQESPPNDAESVARLLPSAQIHAHPDLPEVEVRPPDFLSPLEAMKDIYFKVKGRASRKTLELLEGIALEDLLSSLRQIHEREELRTHADARLRSPIHRALKDDPGPLLLGLNDPKLTELWRLFLDGWDIWLPDGREDGVELFWEGEAEGDDGEPCEILQTLALVEGEVVLSTRLGPQEDELTFDGEGFFRLSTKKALPREVR